MHVIDPKYRDAVTIAGVTLTGKFHPYLFQTIPAKSSWDTWAVSRIPSNQCWKISLFFQHKVTEKHLIIKIELGGGGGRTSGTYFVSQFFCTKATRSTQRKSCYTTKRSYPLGVWKGVYRVKTENKKITKKKQNSEPYVLMFSSVNEVKFASIQRLHWARTYDKRNKDIYCRLKYIRKLWVEVSLS